MPAGNRTGPTGMGPRTGRAMGYCSGHEAPGWANGLPGPGFFGRGGRGSRDTRMFDAGLGRGRGWRWRHWYQATGHPRWMRWGAMPATDMRAPYTSLTREQEIDVLRNEAEWLKEQLDSINQRMEELGRE